MSTSESGLGRRDAPNEVRRLGEQRALRITWRDGHVSEYAYAYLRGWCPCAVCQGHSGEHRFVPVDDPDLASIGVVGNYALCLTWNDGHETGIYSYRYLRNLCDCAECSTGAGA